MAKDREKEILQVSLCGNLNESCRLLWIKLWLLFGDQEVKTSRPELCQATKEKLSAFLQRYKRLRKAKAIVTRATYGGKPGAKGIMLKVIPPHNWAK